jgi:hypothetical protein
MDDPPNRQPASAGEYDNRPSSAGPAVIAAVTIRLAAEARRLKLLSAVYYLEMAAQDLCRTLSSEDQDVLEHIVSNVTLPERP